MLHASHSDLSALLSAGGCFLLPSISFGRLHGPIRSLARCSAAVRSRCILPMPVTRTACPFFSRRSLFWPALHLLPRAVLMGGRGRLCGGSCAILRSTLDASAGVPLGIASLWPFTIRPRSALCCRCCGSSRAERALARAVGFRPRRIRSAQRCRVVRRLCDQIPPAVSIAPFRL